MSNETPMMTSPDTEFIRILEATPGQGEASATRHPAKQVPDSLPILGLSDIVIFPGMVAPLLVDTPQSIRLIDDVVAGNRFLALVLQKRADVANPLPQVLWDHGCAARILNMLRFPDTSVRVLVEALLRVRIHGYESQEPYLRARVEVLKDIVEESISLTALSRNAQRQFQEIINLSPAISEQVKINALNADNPGKLSDLVAGNLNLSLEER